jgi:hypothetical protein
MAFFTYFAVGVLIAFWYHTKYNRRNGLLHKIPAIRSYYLICSNLSFLGRSPAQIFQKLETTFREIGSTFRVDFSPFTTTVVIGTPAAAEKLLNSPRLVEKTNEYACIKSWLGDGCGTKKNHFVSS